MPPPLTPPRYVLEIDMTPTYEILPCDCRDAMAILIEPESVDCVVTSPPYFGLRDYGVDGQIGLEPTPEDFVEAMVEVFRGVRRVLKDDGTVWLNLGDSYSRAAAKGGSGPNGKHECIPSYGDARKIMAANAKEGSSDGAVGPTDRPGSRTKVAGLADKQLLGIPWRVAFALQADGWYLRQDIIWHKPNPMPESVKDRCTKAHEYIFLLSKGPRYYFDAEAIREPEVCGRVRGPALHPDTKSTNGNGGLSSRVSDGKRNRRDVWTVPSRPFKGAHFATFPPDLIEPCVLAGCRPGGTVFDPFGGAGTTALVANRHGRNAVLCELNPEYVKMAHLRLALK